PLMKLLLIPGSGAGGNVWHYQVKGIPDTEGISLPGHPDGEPLESIPAYTEWVHDYIHGKGYQDVVLGGHSLGGGIAQQYALEYGNELKGLVLIGTGARLRVRPDILETVKGMIGDDVAWRRYIESTPLSPDPALTEIREMRIKIGPAVLLSDFLCCDKFDIMTRVQDITVPTLIICGTEDIMTPPKYSQFLAAKIPGAKYVLIEGASHSIALEKPEEVNRVIRELMGGL
ncbi:MAG: alpha/beta hydrolase, partial [Dehalococcoidia bacterium]|nr:alpha/beta hydrolase [Dehalococcoidia bacterium]